MASQRGKLRQPPPTQASILSLGLLVFGALLAHLVASTPFAIMQGLYEGIGCCITLGFNPNPYEAVLGAPQDGLKAWEVVYALALFTATSVGSFVFWVRFFSELVDNPANDSLASKLLYGWLADLALPESKSTFTTAFVLADVANDGSYLGYEGLLEHVSIGADREILSIVLTDVNMFVVNIGPEAVKRIDVERKAPIPRVYFDKGQIKNIAFQTVEVIDVEVDQLASDDGVVRLPAPGASD